MTSVHERIAAARRSLIDAGIEAGSAGLDAEVLARHALGWDRARLLSDGRNTPPPGFADRFDGLVARRARREPVAFITGHREFWSLDFEVTPDVLIPRPETELIIEAALARLPVDRVRRIVDVGTGTGCLAIVLAREYPRARVAAIDISSAALAVTARNAARHGVTDRLTPVRGNLLDGVAGPVDLIVSNPPYVPSGVQLSPEIIRFEPPVALYSGVDGLSALAQVIAGARARLAPDGLFVVEFGFGQDDAVAELAAAAGWRDVTIDTDLQGIPRVAIMTG